MADGREDLRIQQRNVIGYMMTGDTGGRAFMVWRGRGKRVTKAAAPGDAKGDEEARSDDAMGSGSKGVTMELLATFLGTDWVGPINKAVVLETKAPTSTTLTRSKCDCKHCASLATTK